MSMNIHIDAKRDITVNKTGEETTQTYDLDVWQTPTNVSYEIVKSDNPLKAYKDWVLSIAQDTVEDVYSDDDIFCENPPISTRIYNAGKVHVRELEEEIEILQDAGYEISVEVW